MSTMCRDGDKCTGCDGCTPRVGSFQDYWRPSQVAARAERERERVRIAEERIREIVREEITAALRAAVAEEREACEDLAWDEAESEGLAHDCAQTIARKIHARGAAK